MNPLFLTNSSVSSEAWTAIVGENDRIIDDLISSEPSALPSKGEPIDDLANCGVEDLPERECDEPVRIGRSAIVPERGVGDETDWDSASSASKDCVVSCSPGYRDGDVDATRATPGEKDGGGLTGAASPGDVMGGHLLLCADLKRV